MWLPIKIADGYEVDVFGNVRSIDRVVAFYDGRRAHRIGKPLKPSTHGDGYLQVVLMINKKAITRKIHRLVAMTFIPNPENKKTVNHKNGNKKDNRVENLEWATSMENQHHAYANNLNRGRKRGEHSCAKPVLNLQTGIFYDCIADAADAHKIHPATLRDYLKGRYKNKSDLILV